LRTKNGESSFPRIASASLRGPAVPRGSVSTENVTLTLYSFSYCDCESIACPSRIACSQGTHLLQGLGHDLWAVVDSEDNIGDTSSSKGFDLVLDHGLVGKLNERLGQCEGLRPGSVLRVGASRGSSAREHCAERETYKRPQTGTETSDENDGCSGCQSLQKHMLHGCAYPSCWRWWCVESRSRRCMWRG
jgi:hypothetical protein